MTAQAFEVCNGKRGGLEVLPTMVVHVLGGAGIRSLAELRAHVREHGIYSLRRLPNLGYQSLKKIDALVALHEETMTKAQALEGVREIAKASQTSPAELLALLAIEDGYAS